MIRKLWAKFDGLDVVCVCNERNIKCKDKGCQEYVVKFTPIERHENRSLSKSPKFREARLRKLTTELNKTSNHIKNTLKKIK